ncbi:haloacid dehalogenase-like hydrolase [Bacillus timonensis]|nr:haloacid dehalogenase-like hydrolase [Bacillus timonensis]
MKRLLDCDASDFLKMNGQEIKRAIVASEGRVILAEVIASFQPYNGSITNAEMAAAFGADLILLNFFDVDNPHVEGASFSGDEVIQSLKHLVGRPVGINLEPVDEHADHLEMLQSLPFGRRATRASLEKAKLLGVDFVCLTGNPKTGVTNKEITSAIRVAREVLGPEGLIIAGKMHGAGVAGETGPKMMTEDVLRAFIEAGADIILIPSPGTIPGFTVERTACLIDSVHRLGALTILTTGTSQEGADEETMKQIALHSKMAGADMYHIGDAGIAGMAIPQNILSYSIVVRGKRHTYRRMAASILR